MIMNSCYEAASIATPESSANAEKSYRTRSWNGENVLHIYPRTFKEVRPAAEEHRGIGSIRGITEKLNWMVSTGVTAIWLGPIYESPGLDGGYDVSNYRKIDPQLGSMEDVEELIKEAHDRDIRVIFDLVPNHTSDQSEWFVASSDPDHPDHTTYKDHYIWRDPVEGELPENIVGGDRLVGLPEGLTVPNNHSSIFSLPQIDEVRAQYGGKIPEGVAIPAVTAWVWHPKRKQFYQAEFMKQQPSLDWANPTVREEMKDVVRFWLDKGIDSFRVDVINHIGKDPELRDEDPAPIGTGIGQYEPGVANPHDQWKQEKLVSYWPTLKKYASELISVLDEEKYKGRNIRFVLEDWMSALAHDTRLDSLRPDKATVFDFEKLLNTNRAHWEARKFGRLIMDYHVRMSQLEGAVPNQVTGNHDTDTLRTRLGSAATARAAHLMLASLPGVLYTWQGDTMGRPNVIVPEDRQKDGKIGKRDGERVPMQWDSSVNGGFSQAAWDSLWLPSVDPKVYLHDNLELQARDPRSPWRLVKEMLHRRKNDPAFKDGTLRLLHTDNPNVLAFARSDPTNPRRQIISVTNFSQDTVEVKILDAQQARGKVTLAASGGYIDKNLELDLDRSILLPPDESYVLDSIG